MAAFSFSSIFSDNSYALSGIKIKRVKNLKLGWAGLEERKQLHSYAMRHSEDGPDH